MITGFRLNNNVIKDSRGRVKFKSSPAWKYDMYHIGVWLEADETRDFEHVDYVEYKLHSSFSRPIKKSRNPSNQFSITFWSWGTFEIEAKVYFVDENKAPLSLKHQLVYELPADTGTNYVNVSKGDV